MRGRKPKPSAVLRLTGTYDKDPKRENKREPEPPAGEPRCPSNLDKIAKAEWKRVAAVLKEMGLFSKAEAMVLEIYCATFSIWRRCYDLTEQEGGTSVNESGTCSRNPNDVRRQQAGEHCTRLLVELGLSPSSRSRVHGREKKETGVVSRTRA